MPCCVSAVLLTAVAVAAGVALGPARVAVGAARVAVGAGGVGLGLTGGADGELGALGVAVGVWAWAKAGTEP